MVVQGFAYHAYPVPKFYGDCGTEGIQKQHIKQQYWHKLKVGNQHWNLFKNCGCLKIECHLKKMHEVLVCSTNVCKLHFAITR